MMNMSTPKQRAKGTPFHRRSVSPGNSSGNSQGVYTASGNLVGTVPAPDFGHSMLQNSNEHKGFSVKKSGMKNPLHSHQPLQPQKHSAVLPKNPHQPQTSKADDFFEEMGLATKPKFKVLASDAGPRATSSRGLGATALLMDDDDLGGEADWDDDADLDDLLND